MGRISFVAFLYVIALSGLVVGGVTLFQKLQFDFGSEIALMKSSDPALQRMSKYAPDSPVEADVVYETKKGPLLLHKWVGAETARKLARGESVSIRYLKSNPARVFYVGDQLPSGAGWLLMGIVAGSVAVFAHRLLRREAGVG